MMRIANISQIYNGLTRFALNAHSVDAHRTKHSSERDQVHTFDATSEFMAYNYASCIS